MSWLYKWRRASGCRPHPSRQLFATLIGSAVSACITRYSHLHGVTFGEPGGNKVQRVKLLSTSLLLIALLLLGTQNIWASQIDTPDAQIPPTFFGLHIHGTVVPRPGMPDPDPWPGVPFAAWRLWDAYVEWPKLQPQSSKWDFSKLDKYVELAAEHNVEILMPLGL